MDIYPFETLVTKQMPEDHDFMAWKLIYDVYHTEEKWIPKNQLGLAKDCYDKNVLFRVGVYTTIDWKFPEIEVKKRGNNVILPSEFIPKGSLIAHHRIIRWPSIFMFVEEYENIGIGLLIEQGRHVAEGSRLVVHRRFRDIGLSYGGVAFLVFKKLKELCDLHGIKRFYTATTSRLMRVIKGRGLNFEIIKKQKIRDLLTGQDVSIEVGVMDMERFFPK